MAQPIDISRDSLDIFLDLVSAKNPNLPKLTKQNTSVRGLTTVDGLNTSCEVDLLVAPSETVNDYVSFNYKRVPVESLFSLVDKDTTHVGVQIPYDLADKDMLVGSIVDFETIYNSFYRFSHLSGSGYPANAGELQQWSYNKKYDYIMSEVNSATYVGFISGDMTDDYLFNTIVSSEDSDDDMTAVILAAFKQDDIDSREHSLSVVASCGGNGDGVLAIYDNYQQKDQKLIHVLDSYVPPVNPNNQWSRQPWANWYAHVFARRIGNEITVYAKRTPMPSATAGQSKEDLLSKLRTELSFWDESDFAIQGYKTYVIDLATACPKFNRTTRYGYGQWSQNKTRFWNIRRPNDTPAVTQGLQDWFTRQYNYNIGTVGIKLTQLGADRFHMDIDNYTYKGGLELVPKAKLL